MARLILRRSLLAVLILAAISALPGKVAAQSPTWSTQPSDQPTSRKVEIAELHPVELPTPASEIPTGRSPDSASVFGRDAYFRASAAAMPAAMVINSTNESKPHRFWDRENAVLFSAVGTMAAADFYVTHANLASGGKELNPITRVFARSTPGLAANFALETGGVISLSYLFHKTGHHRLERVTSLLSISSSSAAVAYDLTHR